MEIPKELSFGVKKALRRLSMGDLTCGEMFSYLTDPRKANSVSQEIAQRVVCLLTEEGFLDDKRYLKIFVRHLDEKKFGPRRIRQELIKHRFPTRFVEKVLERNVDYTKRAVAFLEKKAGAEGLCRSPEGRKKLQDALVRYGYDFGTAHAAVEKFSSGVDFSD
ncbi:MAG: RecX family transcriptional regulator [Clostridia bacterium]|nr:RecX family transcriptional regulator [Clostridia bacterium]